MNIELIITIIGSFGLLALAINAFFLKGIYTELNSVKVEIAGMISNVDHIQAEITRVNNSAHAEIAYLKNKSHTLANQLQSILLEIDRLKQTIKGVNNG